MAIDFPYLTNSMAMGDVIESIQQCNTSTKFRWPFPGDLLQALATRSIFRFIKTFEDARYVDDVSINDFKPLSMRIILTLNSLRRGGL
ncbi:MAG: hypothetical protein ACFFDQ_07765 [Candidatus Thorarchaeota archaeon]